MMPMPVADTDSNTCAHAAGYAARTLPDDRPLLHVRVGSRDLAVPTGRVRAVVKVERLALLPRSDTLICAATYLDGEVIAVVDLAVRLGIGRSRLGPRSCVVIVDAQPSAPSGAGGPMAWRLADASRAPALALLVDETSGLLAVRTEDPAGPLAPPDPPIPASLVAGAVIHRSRPIPLLDLARVLDEDALAGLSSCETAH